MAAQGHSCAFPSHRHFHAEARVVTTVLGPGDRRQGVQLPWLEPRLCEMKTKPLPGDGEVESSAETLST